MSKFTDAIAAALKAYFETGDQPSAIQFGELIDAIQQGLEEHDHDGTGGGDAANAGAAGITNRTRKVFIPAEGAEKFDPYSVWVHAEEKGYPCADGLKTYAYGTWYVPEDFVSTFAFRLVVLSASSGTLEVSSQICAGAHGEAWNIHNPTYWSWATAITGSSTINVLTSYGTFTSFAKGDAISLAFARQGNYPTDTVNDVVYFVGWIAEYTADS